VHTTGKDASKMSLVTVPLGPSLTAEQARAIYSQGEEAVVFALLQLAQLSAAATKPAPPSPSTPSGMIPPYQKEAKSSRRKKRKPGAQPGHAGHRRAIPDRIDEFQEHRLERCPQCQGKLTRCSETRIRYTEDIPADITPVVTQHTIHRDWCSHCQKRVEPKLPDVLPGAMLGNRVLVLAAWLHYALGNTLSQIVEVFNHHLQMKISPGGLMQMWYRLQAVLYEWYEQLQAEAQSSAVLHADETGWRVDGKTHWLWCFSNPDTTYYLIDRCRGGPALARFFTQEFGGTLVSDFWGAYNKIACAQRQTCLVHLLRDLEFVEQYKRPGAGWAPFAKKLRRLLGDAIRLWKRDAVPEAEYASRRARIDVRLQELLVEGWDDPQAKRLIKRLRRHQNDLFTFLDHDDVPFDNNHAERAIRPAVIIRKNSYNNRSQRGADTQAVLMSIYRTLKQRGHDPLQTVIQALRTYATTGRLPALPSKVTASG
jgi:transposase